MSLTKRLLYILSFIIFLGCLVSIGLLAWKFSWYVPLISALVTLLIYYGMNISLGIYLYYNKKRINITKKSWLFCLLLLPGFGFIIFLWTGFNPFFKKDLALLKKNFTFVQDLNNSDYHLSNKRQDIQQILNYCNNQCVNQTSSGDVDYIENEYELYKKVIAYIRGAKKYIFIDFYIFADGFFLRAVMNELYIQHQKGIKIYIMYDWVGCRKKNRKHFFDLINESGIPTYTFKKKSFYIVSSLDNSRNHKKSLIIDGDRGIIGGFNIADEYINQGKQYKTWKDHAYEIKGSIVKDYLKLFLLDWINFTTDPHKELIVADIKQICNETKTPKHNNNYLVQTYSSFPEDKYAYAYNFYLMMLTKPLKRLWIYTPYFYPTEALEHILICLVKANVDVRLMLPGYGDNKPFYVDINRNQYKNLLNHGIKIYEYNGFSHVKSIIIDDDINLIGTVNIDPRALDINYESVSLVVSDKLNNQLTIDFKKMINNSLEINHEVCKQLWKQKPWWDKIYTKCIVNFLLIFEPLL